jgi:dual specificity phosphatase 3
MSTLSVHRPRRPDSPQTLWRKLCWVNEQLAVSGDLSANRHSALTQLREWEDAGVTDVFDMRGEADDSVFIHRNSELITSHWFGVDDAGTTRSDAWFDEFVDRAQDILEDSKRKILVHCHMGVNRGPSALFAIMLSFGWDHLDALRAIRDVRPIAGIIYAPDAVNWFARNCGFSDDVVKEMERDVRQWLQRNDLDISYVIRSIGNRLAI